MIKREAFLDGLLEGLSSISFLFTQMTATDIDRIWRKSFPYQKKKKNRLGSFDDDRKNIYQDFNKAIRSTVGDRRL